MNSSRYKISGSPKFFLATLSLTLFFNFMLVLLILFNSIPVSANEMEQDDLHDSEIVNNLADIGQGTLLFKQQQHYSKAAQLETDVAMAITGMINRQGSMRGKSDHPAVAPGSGWTCSWAGP